MKIIILSEQTKVNFARTLVANELGGRLSLVYVFSDAGGQSGLSFGIAQIDVTHSPYALLALRDIGFTTDEITALRNYRQQPFALAVMNDKLAVGRDAVDRWDRKQINDCLTWPLALCTEIGVDFSGEEAFVHVADYHNQFGMSRGGKLYKYLQTAAGLTVTPEMILAFKYTTVYGQKQLAKTPPAVDDVKRRYDNIVRIMQGA